MRQIIMAAFLISGRAASVFCDEPAKSNGSNNLFTQIVKNDGTNTIPVSQPRRTALLI